MHQYVLTHKICIIRFHIRPINNMQIHLIHNPARAKIYPLNRYISLYMKLAKYTLISFVFNFEKIGQEKLK